MADVQIENGYTMIASELIDQFQKIKLSGRQWNILMVIIRQTYGYHRKECSITNNFIAEATGQHKCNVSRELSSLQSFGIIRIEEVEGKRMLSINKDYEHWNFTAKSVIKIDNHKQLSNPITEVIKNDNSKLSNPITEVIKNDNHTYNIYFKDNSKDNIKDTEVIKTDNLTVAKMTTPKPDFSAEFESLWKLYPRKKGKSSVTKKAMKELQQAGFETVKEAIENYKEEIRKNRTEERYILHGSTFFNGRWRDYIADESEVNGDADPYANVGLTL